MENIIDIVIEKRREKMINNHEPLVLKVNDQQMQEMAKIFEDRERESLNVNKGLEVIGKDDNGNWIFEYRGMLLGMQVVKDENIIDIS